MIVVAVDPGRRKCGVAVVSSRSGVMERQIVPLDELEGALQGIMGRHSPGEVLVGGSTGSKHVIARLKQILARSPRVVDERHTTERARKRYFVDHPPRGLWKLVPLGLQVPPVPVDDYAAVVMAEEFLATQASVNSSDAIATWNG